MNLTIIAFIAIIQSLLFACHYLIYRTVLRFFSVANTHLAWTKVIFFILSISFILASVVAFRFYGPVTRVVYSAVVIWLGTVYWLLIASVITWFVYSFSSYEKKITPVATIIFLAALATSSYGVWNSYQTKIRQVTVHIENLPDVWKGKKAVVVADTHLGNVRNLKFSEKIANLVQAQNPDIVFIPGDFYDGTPTDYTKLAEPFGKIKTTYGVYFAPGNHEQFGDKSPFLDGLSQAGVRVLDNELVTLEGVQIIGVDYLSTTNVNNQKKVLENLDINEQQPSILIKHVPSVLEVARNIGIDLQVSGHTHLGQVWPMAFVTKSIYGQFYYGLSRTGNTQVLTTSGAGTWGPPQRVGTNSEIVVITFE